MLTLFGRPTTQMGGVFGPCGRCDGFLHSAIGEWGFTMVGSVDVAGRDKFEIMKQGPAVWLHWKKFEGKPQFGCC
jgi:hypothetical protein